jgi:MFS transporter, PHS family, inorganic phosphate transporter
LNSSTILTVIGFGSSSTSGIKGKWESLHNVCVGNIILSVAGLIPGYYATMLFIDSWGRKPIQLMGFSILTTLFVIMGMLFNSDAVRTLVLIILIGFAYDKLNSSKTAQDAFVFLYCLTNFFQNFGPNSTTFVIPGEAFPTRYRSTAHGISAASGKLGAIIAQVGFSRMINIGGTGKFLQHILEIFAFFMLTGVFSTLLLPETKGRSLEELSNENQEGFVKGTSRGERK